MPLFARIKTFARTAASISARKGSIFKKLDDLADIRKSSVEAVIDKAAQRLVGAVRAELAISYAQSGLKTQSGTLKRAAVTNAIVERGAGGIFIRMQRGASYPGDKKGNVYSAAGVFRYGGIRQPLTKAAGSLVVDLPTGKMRKRKFAAGEFGDRAKRSLKKKFFEVSKSGQTQFGQVTYLKPKDHFFQLSSYQQDRLRKQFNDYVAQGMKELGID